MTLTSFESGALVFTGVHRKRMPSARNESRQVVMRVFHNLRTSFILYGRAKIFMGALKSLFGAFKN